MEVTEIAAGVTKPSGMSPDAEEWTRKDELAQALIMERITMDHHHLVENYETAAAMWENIRKHFGKDKTLSPAYAISTMFSRSWSDSSETLESLFKAVQENVNDLRRHSGTDRKSTRLNSSHSGESRMPSSA